MTRLSRIAVVLCGLALTSATADAAPLMFDFTGFNLGSGSWGNTRTFTSGGITVTASAWGYTQGSHNNAFQTGALGQWSTGLGVCNRDEGSPNCGNPNHQVDNVGSDDWVLFVFSEAVNVDYVRIDPHGNRDRDVSYYVGNVTTPLGLTGRTYGDLTSSLGFQERRSSTSGSSDSARNVDIAGGFVNAVLFGGYYGGSDQDDYFKIASIRADSRDAPPPPPPAPVPEPATLLLTVGGLGAMAVRRKLRRS